MGAQGKKDERLKNHGDLLNPIAANINVLLRVTENHLSYKEISFKQAVSLLYALY
jgi:hypothetical protein